MSSLGLGSSLTQELVLLSNLENSPFSSRYRSASSPVHSLSIWMTMPRGVDRACPVETSGVGPDIVRAAVAAAPEINSPGSSGLVMTCEAVASAARSNRSAGWLIVSPPPRSVPATGPWRCWMTWVSSWAMVCLSAPLWPMTTWFPEV